MNPACRALLDVGLFFAAAALLEAHALLCRVDDRRKTGDAYLVLASLCGAAAGLCQYFCLFPK